MNTKKLKNYVVLTFLAIVSISASADTSSLNVAGTKQVLFSTAEDGNHPYRMPAIATLLNGDILAISDYRPCNKDLGYGEVDIYAKISKDNGATWTPSTKTPGKSGGLKIADGSSSNGYGYEAVVVDRESGDVLIVCESGKVPYSSGTSSNHNTISQIRATYDKSTGNLDWTSPEDKNSEFYKGNLSDARGIRTASGRIIQSTKVKFGTHYRIYCALIVSQEKNIFFNENVNYVVYSDDFGTSWNVLGGTSCITGGDEAKVEELPNGDIVISSRMTGGRYFNVFNFTDLNYASGSWNSSSSYTFKTRCAATNGELLLYKNITKKDGTQCNLLFQSLPTGSNRTDVSIFYKEISTDETKQYQTNDFTTGWSEAFQVESGNSAYSTMTVLGNGEIGFIYEDDYTTSTYDGGGCEIVYIPLTVSEITGGAYMIETGGSSVIEDVKTEDAKEVYYNLQGVKVENPEKGVYVKVQGDKSTKVAL